MAERAELELVELALGGDIRSFGKLCGKYYNSMAAIAYSVLLDHHLAEDAAQETFLRALKNLDKLKNRKKFGFWLAGICRNVAKDSASARTRNINFKVFASMTDNHSNEKEIEAVKKALNSLSAADRELIVLRYYNNMSHARISEVLGLTKPATNNRLNRVRKKIARYLQNNGFAEVEL